MKKSMLTCITITLVLAMMLAACSSSNKETAEKTAKPDNSVSKENQNEVASGKGTKEKVTLRMSIVAGTDEMLGWQGIVDAFNNSHDNIQVKLERISGGWNEYGQKITAEIAAGDPPDIGRLGALLVPMFTSKGQLEDLYPYAHKLDMSQYYESAFSQYIQNGKMYAAPTGIYTMAMYYNKDMFDKAGIQHPPLDWNHPWTWDDMEKAAAKLSTGQGAQKQYGVYVDLNPERSIQYLWSNGGGFISDDKSKVTINTPESKEALSYLQGLIKKGYSPTPGAVKTTPSGELFKAGRLGMIVEGQWMMGDFSKIDKFKWGIAPIAASSKGRSYTPNFVDAYVAFKGTKHPEEVWEAINFFLGEKAENILVDHNLAGIPVLKSVAENRKGDMFNPLPQEEKDVWFQSVDHSKSLPFTTNWNEMMNATMKKFDLVAFDKLDAQQAAEELAPQLDKLLSQTK